MSALALPFTLLSVVLVVAVCFALGLALAFLLENIPTDDPDE